MTQVYVFGGAPAQPNTVTLEVITLSADIQLQWPWIDQNTVNPVPLFMDITPTAAHSITMPDATGAGNGWATIFCNNGPFTITVLKNDGSGLATIASGFRLYIVVTDNSTAAGSWNVTTFGVGTSAADASALAGAGLRANGIQIQTNDPVVHLVNSYSVTAIDRAMAFTVDAGIGAGTLSIDSAATLGNGFWFLFTNLGTGSWTIDPNGGDTIDEQPTLVINPSESCIVIGDGVSEFATFGRGRSVIFVSTATNINVAGNSDVMLTATQAGNTQIKFTGVLTGNINVVFPAVVGEWYINNATTGSFTITAKSDGGTGISCPQGQQVVIKSDSSAMLSAFTAVPTGTSSMSDGSTSAPGLAFTNENTTGFSRPTAGQMSVSVLATEVFRFTQTLITSLVNYTVKLVDAGAAVGPLLTLWRSSTSPAPADVLGSLNLDGMDSGANQTTYAAVRASIVDATDTSEDGTLDFLTVVAGALAKRGGFGQGFIIGSATDGGAGTLALASTTANMISAVHTDAGAATGPNVVLTRDSASPASNDFIGSLDFYGKDSGNNLTLYADFTGQIIDPTDGSEDAWFVISTMTAGSYQQSAKIGNSTLQVISFDGSSANGPSLVLDRASASPAASDLIGRITFSGRTDTATTQNFAQIGSQIINPSHTTPNGTVDFFTVDGDGQTIAQWRASVGAGFYTATATGGDMGAGTVNATNYYKNGALFGVTTGQATYVTSADITTAITINDTAPTIANGVQILSSGSLTVAAAQSVELSFNGIVGLSANVAVVMLFRDSTLLDVVECSGITGFTTTPNQYPMTLEYVDAPGAGSFTYTVRAAVSGSNPIRFNGAFNGRHWGGSAKTKLIWRIS